MVEMAEDRRQAEERITVEKAEQVKKQQDARERVRAELVNLEMQQVDQSTPEGARKVAEYEFEKEWAAKHEAFEQEVRLIETLEERRAKMNQFFFLLREARAKNEEDIGKSEKEREQQLWDAKAQMAASYAGSLSGIFSELYQLSGKNSKEMLALSKAAGMAEVVISTQAAIMKALQTSGWAGYAQAGLIAAQGAIALAKIQAQGLAQGGLVGGYSPHKRADNIPAQLTAGE